MTVLLETREKVDTSGRDLCLCWEVMNIRMYCSPIGSSIEASSGSDPEDTMEVQDGRIVPIFHLRVSFMCRDVPYTSDSHVICVVEDIDAVTTVGQPAGLEN